MDTEQPDLLIIGSGTAATNAARAATRAGAQRVVVVHRPERINTCVEAGCMPSKSVLAGAHQGESFATVMETKDAHIARLRGALLEGINAGNFTVVVGRARFCSDTEVAVDTDEGTTTYTPQRIIIATGSTPFVPPIDGLDTLGDRLLVSDDVVGEQVALAERPERILTIGAGPIGLELSTFFHDLGSQVTVLHRGDRLLPALDPEFGAERLRASQGEGSFPIQLQANLLRATRTAEGVQCLIGHAGEERTETYDYVLMATGRTPNIADLDLPHTSLARDERGGIVHDDTLQTSVPHIYLAGDVTGHHQILHYAAKMGERAAYNALQPAQARPFEYAAHQLAISFDQYPSGLIGLTEEAAAARGIAVATATRYFNSIGLGILKRQEYGLWKLVAEAGSGRILGAQVLGPDSAGELLQLAVPLIANQHTAHDVCNMTWYHPTYAEILHSLARDICGQESVHCPGVE